MPKPTLGAFQYVTPDNVIVYVGNTILNQIVAVNGETRAERPVTTVRRIGDVDATQIAGTPQYSSNCTVRYYHEPDLADWKGLSGNTGNGPFSINSNTMVTLRIEVYDTSGNKKVEHVLEDAYIVSDTMPQVEANTTPLVHELRFESLRRWRHQLFVS